MNFPLQVADYAVDYSHFGNVFMLGNGKGGVGKTTLTANAAAKTARQGLPTLAIDVNGQGNMHRDLGYGEQDQGKSFAESMASGAPLLPLEGVRQNLDVVVGGIEVRKINGIVTDVARNDGFMAAYLRLAVCLAPILPRYKAVFIDTPPENPDLLRLCLLAARYAVVPVKYDAASLDDGLKDFGQAFQMAVQLNRQLRILGVAHCFSQRNATNIHKEIEKRSRKVLGKHAHVFPQAVGHSSTMAGLIRDRGQTAYELEQERKAGAKGIPDSAQPLANDYEVLVTQIFQRAAEMRTAA
ncbi:ParA family protein [Streptomyces erythrochromogenes]|uniref:ParA family protein n=1 Tax=Streptomyces erythrochromogenes TaxID=285574 RepID=UPI00342B41D2